jgi:hypothetical protein
MIFSPPLPQFGQVCKSMSETRLSRRAHAAVFGSPLVETGVAEAVPAPQFFDGHSGFGLPQNPMICSSLYLLILMSVILLVDGLLGIYAGTGTGGQVTHADDGPQPPRSGQADPAPVDREGICEMNRRPNCYKVSSWLWAL